MGRTFAAMPCSRPLALEADFPDSEVGPRDLPPLARLIAARSSGVFLAMAGDLDGCRAKGDGQVLRSSLSWPRARVSSRSEPPRGIRVRVLRVLADAPPSASPLGCRDS